MSKSEKQKLILRLLVLAMLIGCVTLFSTGASRGLLSSQDGSITLPKRSNNARSQPTPKSQPTPPTLSGLLQKSSKHSALPPVEEFGQRAIESQPDQDRRRIRESLHGKGFYRRPIEDPGTREVNGQAETIALTFVDGVTILKAGQTPDPQGLPVSSTAVVIGTVLSGKAFVSENRDFVYSDYKIRIDRVVKPDVARAFEIGDEITTWVPGGSVHFPSGHTKHFLIDGRGFPQVGAKYVLFLGRDDPRLNEYEIWTAYELKNGVVLPLDAANDRFENTSADNLLVTIQNAVRIQSGGQ